MDSYVGVEVFVVKAKDEETALDKAKQNARKGSVTYVAPDLSVLPHPVHLAEVHALTGYKKEVEENGG